MTNQFSACLDAFKEYRDQYGLNQVRKGTDPEATSENGVLFTVEYLMCLEANIKSMEDYAEYLVETRRVVPVFNSCDWLPGLMRRYPGCLFNPDSMDNHVARLAFDMKHNDGQFAMAMINHDKNQRCDGAEPGSEKWLTLAKILGLLRH